MNIVYSLTKGNYEMVFVSLQSLLDNNKKSSIKIYFLLDNSIDKELLKNFEIYKNYENCLGITYLNVDRSKYCLYEDKINFNEIFYSFEIPNLIKDKRVLYLSPFSLITSNIEEFYNIDFEGCSFAAAEFVFSNWVRECFNIKKDVIFDNSILLFNNEKLDDNYFFEKFKNLKSKDLNFKEDSYKYTPLELFNYFVDDCKQVSIANDYAEIWYKSDSTVSLSKNEQNLYKNFLYHIDTPKIINFIGPKPIKSSVKCQNSYVNLWWKYAERTPIYKEIKEFSNLNKYKLSATTAQNAFKYTWLLSRIYPYIKPYWFRILLGFLIAIPLGLLDGVTAFALKPYMDYVIGGKAFEYSWHGFDISVSSLQMAYVIPIGVILFAALQGVLRYLNGYFSSWVSARITNDVKFDLFERLIHMHPQFFDDNSSGIVISRYMGDPGAASAGIVDNIKTITTALCGALGLIAVMLYSSWQLAFIGVLVLCVAFIPVALIRKRLKEASNKNMVIGSKITTNINETYSGNKVMTAYGLQDRQNEYFKEQVWKSYHIGMSLYKRAGWMSPMMYLIASCGIAAVLGVGTYLINSGQMTAGAFASFVTSLLLLYKPVKTLGNTLTGIQNIFVAMGRVFELFDLTPAIMDCENPKEMTGFNDSISFENVVFEYVPGKPVLKNLNLNIKKNETLAIVGNSGGGKSTLVNLIPRFYDIKSGSLKFDGVDIKEFSLKSLRQNISMVFQDNFLFSGTIKENIMMGNPDATVEELMEAIKSAHLQDMIAELPDGLDTELGERGLTLSGGQRQRVAIARAMLRNAPIVILDEATSALDNESEAIVQKAMDNLMQNRTVFIIAHRLSTIKNADRIAVINEGELVELGSHDELIQIENGQYKHLYEMQFKKQEEVKV